MDSNFLYIGIRFENLFELVSHIGIQYTQSLSPEHNVHFLLCRVDMQISKVKFISTFQ